jgi:hypothetical protein
MGDREDSKVHSSLYTTLSTITSMNNSNYYNSLVSCEANGQVMLTRVNSSSYWDTKHKVLFLSFAVKLNFIFKFK